MSTQLSHNHLINRHSYNNLTVMDHEKLHNHQSQVNSNPVDPLNFQSTRYSSKDIKNFDSGSGSNSSTSIELNEFKERSVNFTLISCVYILTQNTHTF